MTSSSRAELADAPRVTALAGRMKEILALESEPVAVFLLRVDSPATDFVAFKPLAGHRYCQAVMKAHHGEFVALMPNELAC